MPWPEPPRPGRDAPGRPRRTAAPRCAPCSCRWPRRAVVEVDDRRGDRRARRTRGPRPAAAGHGGSDAPADRGGARPGPAGACGRVDLLAGEAQLEQVAAGAVTSAAAWRPWPAGPPPRPWARSPATWPGSARPWSRCPARAGVEPPTLLRTRGGSRPFAPWSRPTPPCRTPTSTRPRRRAGVRRDVRR